MSVDAPNYCKRVWLNPEDSSSTGAIIAFSGDSAWSSDGKSVRTQFLEIKSCHDVVRIHRSDKDSLEAFATKLRLMAKTIDDFALVLESALTKQE